MKRLTKREKHRIKLTNHEIICLIIALSICIGLLLYSVISNSIVIPVNKEDDKEVNIVYKQTSSVKNQSKVESNSTPNKQVNLMVNINTADINTLILLNGIGQTKAQAIIDYRNQNGSFKTIEDIMKVAGIKEITFEKIKNNITVG